MDKNTTYTISGTYISYDLHGYQKACQQVRDAKSKIDKLPEDIRNQVLSIARDIVEGVLKANKKIYGPVMDREKLEIVNKSVSDYKTDMDGLDNLIALFLR